MLPKFARLNLKEKISAMNFFNSGVAIYLSWLWSVIFFFFFQFYYFLCYSQFFLSKLLTLGILFSTAVRALVVAKLLILGILPLTSFILVLIVVFVAKLVISGILSSTFFYLSII